MLKVAFAAAAATLVSAAVAQAQTRGDDAVIRRYEAITPYHSDSVGQDDSDRKVMGLSVPNGFREPAAIYGRPRAY